MHTSKFTLLACSLAGIASSFLSWTNAFVLGQSKTLTGTQHSEGLLNLLCFTLVASCVFLHGRALAFSKNQNKMLLAAGLVAAAGTYFKIYTLQHQAAKMFSFKIDMGDYVVYNPTYGIYLSAVAALCIALCSVFHMVVQVRMQYAPRVGQAVEGEEDSAIGGRFYIPA